MRHTVKIVLILGFLYSPLALTRSIPEIKKELREVKRQIPQVQGGKKERLMKKMARLENELLETRSGADRNKSKR